MIVRRFHPSARRWGITSLIEALVSITLIGVLFTSTATLTALLFRLDRLGRDDLGATVTQGRLAATFRADVHDAREVEAGDEHCSITAADETGIDYRIRGGHLVRTRPFDDGPDHVETFRLRPGTLVRWERDEPGGRPIVSLILDLPPTPKAAEGRRRVFRIEAAVGRDQRFNGGRS